MLARELGFEEMQTIVEKTPADMEIETFVHGAMCISYSGRCLLSHYMTGRNSTRVTAPTPAAGNTTSSRRQDQTRTLA